ncbi:hypothetical protein D3C80_1605350 [compost metagenome]
MRRCRSDVPSKTPDCRRVSARAEFWQTGCRVPANSAAPASCKPDRDCFLPASATPDCCVDSESPRRRSAPRRVRAFFPRYQRPSPAWLPFPSPRGRTSRNRSRDRLPISRANPAASFSVRATRARRPAPAPSAEAARSLRKTPDCRRYSVPCEIPL